MCLALGSSITVTPASEMPTWMARKHLSSNPQYISYQFMHGMLPNLLLTMLTQHHLQLAIILYKHYFLPQHEDSKLHSKS